MFFSTPRVVFFPVNLFIALLNYYFTTGMHKQFSVSHSSCVWISLVPVWTTVYKNIAAEVIWKALYQMINRLKTWAFLTFCGSIVRSPYNEKHEAKPPAWCWSIFKLNSQNPVSQYETLNFHSHLCQTKLLLLAVYISDCISISNRYLIWIYLHKFLL